MLNKNAKKWVRALRSRKYKQTTNSLSNEGKFCCMGVACELAVKAGVIKPSIDGVYDGASSYPPPSVVDWLGLKTNSGEFKRRGKSTELTTLNDEDGKKFYQIANVIESEPEGLFKA